MQPSFQRGIEYSTTVVNSAIIRNRLFKNMSTIDLNTRQNKVMTKLLNNYPDEFSGFLTNKKYVSITKTSKETAKRDIKKLVTFGLIRQKEGKGRSTSYSLCDTTL